MTPAELKKAVKGGTWDEGDPLTAEQVRSEAARAGLTLPDELATFQAWVNDGHAGLDVYFFNMPDFLDAASQDKGRLPPEGWFIASDSGMGFFFFDPTGKLTGIAGAVVWADRSNLVPRDTVPVAKGLVDFLRVASHAEEDLGSQETLRDRAIQRMKDALAPARVKGGEGLAFPYREFILPLELNGLLEVRNGLRLTPEVRLFTQDELALASTDDGEEIGVWMGEGPRERYLVTFTSARWEEGQLLRVREGQRVGDAEDLGWMPEVMVEVLEGKRSLG